MVSALVYLTGGVTSYFSTLYTLPIIAASTVRSRRGGLLVGDPELDPLHRAGAGAVLTAGRCLRSSRARTRFRP